MKKLTALFLSVILVCLLTACLPERSSSVLDIGPDEDGLAGTEVDFDLLGVDALEGIDDMEPFSFVTRIKTEGDNGSAKVAVTVGTMDEVLKEDADAFTAALLKSMGNAAAFELLEYNAPAKDSFGDFWDTFSVTVEFYKDDDLEKEGAVPYHVYEHKAGEPFALDPDTEKYVKDYYKRKEILERNL